VSLQGRLPDLRGKVPRRVIVATVASALLAAAFVVPIPVLYVLVPGPVQDIERRVEVSGARTYSSTGRLYLTTVGVDVNATAVEIALAAFDTTTVVVPARQVTGGRPLDQLESTQRAQMATSKRNASVVALGAAGFGRPTGEGARVLSTVEGSPADGLLRRGDVITSVDRGRVATVCDVGRVVDAVDIGDRLDITVRRAGREEQVTLSAGRDQRDRAYLGVALTNVAYEFEPDVEVTFPTGRVAGPSAGLMLALALYDRLTPSDLTSARDIAGTGILDCAGGVGPIGGVEQKVVAAERRGAEVFLAPTENVEAARAAGNEIDVIGVSTFDNARRYLEGPAP
jgi:Lon-like protease